MKIFAIIAEYNPFHNGHAYQITRAREMGADMVVVIMSGHFMQRGEPAIMNKWDRAAIALLNGADMVLELPLCYAVSSAEGFARGAVEILHKTGIADHLIFGSEAGELQTLKKIAKTVDSKDFEKELKENLVGGKTFAKTRSQAVSRLTGIDESVIKAPNNILAIEYLRALRHFDSKIKPVTIKRTSDYNSEEMAEICSASAVRKEIFERFDRANIENLLEKIKKSVPENSLSYYENLNPPDINKLSPILHYVLSQTSRERLKNQFGLKEGLENKIYKSAAGNYLYTDIADGIKSKRYTYAGIMRMLIKIALNIESFDKAQYIRVLGFRADSEKLLGRLCERAKLPVVINLKNSPKLLGKKAQGMLEAEIRATEIYNLILKDEIVVKNYEWVKSIVKIEL